MLAVFLQKQGIQTQVLEAAAELNDQPRACHYGGPSKYELERAGVLDAISAEGFHPDAVSWRRRDGSQIVKLDSSDEPESSLYRMVCLPLGRVVQILRDAAVANGCEILLQHKVTPNLGTSDGKAWVDVEVPSGGTKRFEADYVVGCDGANSQVRRALFGDLEFPGSTWDQQIIASNVSQSLSTAIGLYFEESPNSLPSWFRSITPLRSSATTTQILSCTRATGTWPQRSPPMACGV